MGTRSTFVSEDWGTIWPDWFREKYAKTIHFPDEKGPISSKMECKTYGVWAQLPYDIQKVWREENVVYKGHPPIRLIFYNEDEDTYLLTVSHDKVTLDTVYRSDWYETDVVGWFGKQLMGPGR